MFTKNKLKVGSISKDKWLLTWYAFMCGVSSELIFLRVGLPENVITNSCERLNIGELGNIKHSDCCKTGCRLPFRRIIPVAPRVLSDCGCTTRNMAWRPYVKGTQARSPNANINPNPSCTMSIVVSTASCRHKENGYVVCIWDSVYINICMYIFTE